MTSSVATYVPPIATYDLDVATTFGSCEVKERMKKVATVDGGGGDDNEGEDGDCCDGDSGREGGGKVVGEEKLVVIEDEEVVVMEEEETDKMEGEIQRLRNENRRLVDEGIISQYELDVAREELHRKNVIIDDIRTEHEVHCRQLMKRGLQLIDQIPNIEPLKNEVKRLRSEVSRLLPLRYRFDVESEIQSVVKKIRAFCSQILQQVDKNLVHCQVLFLSSTAERARQIEKLMQALCDHLEVKIHNCLGDNSIEVDERIVSIGVHLIVGTPWSVSDLLGTKKQSVHFDHIRMVVLDEADEILSKGFDVQIHNILSLLSDNVEVVALYPTMPTDALEITRKLMNKPTSTMNLWQSIVFL
ncbi:eukaryotic initiation factor 4A-like [Solanum dulcamara]|uniref:eukaryotic initiation factor 4A-like n=1 Tax=Solanum dulcamara TaxID=45834 RepID=UPI00248669F5|nr:eukaryotic initiation factor 4A-like [Solanum dulcamara]